MLTTTIITATVAFILGTAAGHLASTRTTTKPDLIIHITRATDPWPPSEIDEFMRSYRRHPSTQFTRETEKE